jgi:hypothetical protein
MAASEKSFMVKKLVKIYGRVLLVEAQKLGFHLHCDAECKRCQHKYVHEFKPGARLMGIPDGAYLTYGSGSQTRTVRLSNGSMLISDREY